MLFDLSDYNMFYSICPLLVLNFVSQGPGDRPVVVLFGWAGAKHKHLDKYAELYRWGRSWNDPTDHLVKWENFLTIIFWTTRDHGCDTVQYILPTRFIFRHTDQVLKINYLSLNWKGKKTSELFQGARGAARRGLSPLRQSSTSCHPLPFWYWRDDRSGWSDCLNKPCQSSIKHHCTVRKWFVLIY